MYCKYCGKQVDSDSSFCKHCGRNIGYRELGLIPILKEFNITTIIQIVIKWLNCVWAFLKTIFVFIWKVIKTIGIVIASIVVYTFVGFFMSPLIALFDADLPSFEILSLIKDIWRKEEKTQKINKSEVPTPQKDESSSNQISNAFTSNPIVPPSLPPSNTDDDLPF